MKSLKAVRLLLLTLFLPSCLLLTSCTRHDLPSVEDMEALHKDCAALYEQFHVGQLLTNAPDYDYQSSLGIRIIPREKWPASILELHPYMVCCYQGGIQVWIAKLSFKEEGKFWQGYYIEVKPEQSPPPRAATNHFVFKQTDKAGIFLLKQLKF